MVNFNQFKLLADGYVSQLHGRQHVHLFLEHIACDLWEPGWAIRTLSFKYQESVFWSPIATPDYGSADTEADHHCYNLYLHCGRLLWLKWLPGGWKAVFSFLLHFPLLADRHLRIWTSKQITYIGEFRKSLFMSGKSHRLRKKNKHPRRLSVYTSGWLLGQNKLQPKKQNKI